MAATAMLNQSVQGQAGSPVTGAQHDPLAPQASHVASAAQPALQQLVATLTPSETDYYQHKAKDGKFYVITHNVAGANGMVVSCRATRDIWAKHAAALEAAGLLTAGMNSVIDIRDGDQVFVNNTRSETPGVTNTLSLTTLKATYQAIRDYSKGSPLGAVPPAATPLQPLSPADSLEVLQRLAALTGASNTPPVMPSHVQAREARKLLDQMSRIDHGAVNAHFHDPSIPNPTPEQTQALISDIKTYLSKLIANYNAHMYATHTNPCEAAEAPSGVNNDGNNCFLATAVVLHQQNKILREACEHLLPPVGHPWHAVSQNYNSNPDLKPLRGVLNQPVGQQTQEDVHEFITRLHGNMNMGDAPDSFVRRSSTFIQTDNDWREDSENGSSKRSPIFEMTFNDAAIDANGTPSIEDLLFPSNDGAPYSGQHRLDGPNPATILIHSSRAQAGGGARTTAVDAPLYCTAQALFGREDADGVEPEHYTLQGFSSHTLGSAGQGHYITYLQHQGHFYEINGTQRREITPEIYLQKARTASILNYSKVKTKVVP